MAVRFAAASQLAKIAIRVTQAKIDFNQRLTDVHTTTTTT